MCIFCTKYEVSVIKLWPGVAFTDDNNEDANNIRQKIHGCIGPLVFVPNEPIKSYKLSTETSAERKTYRTPV